MMACSTDDCGLDATEGMETDDQESRGGRCPESDTPQYQGFGELYLSSRGDENDGPGGQGSDQTLRASIGRIDRLLRPLLSDHEVIHRWRRPLLQLVKHYYISDKPYKQLLVFLSTLFSEARHRRNSKETREVDIPVRLTPQLFPTNACLEFLTGLGFEYEGVDRMQNLSQCILRIPPSLMLEVIDAALTVFRALQYFSSQEVNRLTMMEQEDANMLIALVQSSEEAHLQEQLVCSLWDRHQELLERMGIQRERHSRDHPPRVRQTLTMEAETFMYSFYIVLTSFHGAPLSLPQQTYI